MALINVTVVRENTDKAPHGEVEKHHHSNSRPRKKAYFFIGGLVILAIIGLGAAKLLIWKPPVLDPFTPQIESAVQFQLYHPTTLPPGYAVDAKSVNTPASGVVAFTLTGKSNQKIFITEEARPEKYDIGGFFKKFSDLKEIAFASGTIATGKLSDGHTEIGSRINNQVWIIATTTAHLPLNQITILLKNLSSSVT